MQYGVMYNDGSVGRVYNGPHSRAYCEGDAQAFHALVVARTGPQAPWIPIATRYRFVLHLESGPWDAPDVTLRCTECLYETQGHLYNITRPVRRFEDHWAAKHEEQERDD